LNICEEKGLNSLFIGQARRFPYPAGSSVSTQISAHKKRDFSRHNNDSMASTEKDILESDLIMQIKIKSKIWPSPAHQPDDLISSLILCYWGMNRAQHTVRRVTGQLAD